MSSEIEKPGDHLFERKYGKVTAQKKLFPTDEPIFVLRGQDRLAASTVRFYASLRLAEGDAEGARDCMEMAAEIDAWPMKKKPD